MTYLVNCFNITIGQNTYPLLFSSLKYSKRQSCRTSKFSCYKNGQLKVQQMAFVLVAIFIFFGIASLFYFSISLSSLQEDAQELKDKEAREIVRTIAGTPEFIWARDNCVQCIDLDKVFFLKERKAYEKFWNLDYLVVERIFPSEGKGIECDRSNYPNCDKITIVSEENFGAPFDSFVSLCRWEHLRGGYRKCELGIISASGEGID